MFYEHFAESYDDMINWESRLVAEQGDLKKLIAEYGIKTLLDAGCGTGIHPIILSKMGLKVVGVDASLDMLELARKNAQKYGAKNIDFKIGEFTKLDETVKGPFDCVATFGNSLPHLVDDADIILALEQFYNLLKPGGLCLIQLVHFDHYLDSADSAVAVSDGLRNGREVTFRRHYEFKGTKVIFHVSIYDQFNRELLEDYFAPLNAIRKDLLQNFMERVGFVDIRMNVNFSETPVTDADRSLVVFARRPLDEETSE